MQDETGREHVMWSVNETIPPLPIRRERLRKIVGSLQRGHGRDQHHLAALIEDEEVVESFDDRELKSLILVVKHHRPDLALHLLTHVKTEAERVSLGSCLAALWSRVDINAAWHAITASRLPEAERMALRSAMV